MKYSRIAKIIFVLKSLIEDSSLQAKVSAVLMMAVVAIPDQQWSIVGLRLQYSAKQDQGKMTAILRVRTVVQWWS